MEVKGHIEALLACNESLNDVNRKLSNQSDAMLKGISEVIKIIDSSNASTKAEYEELMQDILNSLKLTITRSINYTKQFNIEDR